MVVAGARQRAPNLPIIARAATQSGLKRLAELGAGVVIHPELEGGLEMMRHTLLALNFPAGQVQHFTDAVRRARYNPALNGSQEDQLLDQLWTSMRGLEIVWRRLDEHNALVGQTLAEANLRATTGAYVIAILRGPDAGDHAGNGPAQNGPVASDTDANDAETLYNPPAQTRLQAGDLIGFMGDNTQLARIDEVLAA
jgi:CPA2 family monovalent cation:H+ antiporter-2